MLSRADADRPGRPKWLLLLLLLLLAAAALFLWRPGRGGHAGHAAGPPPAAASATATARPCPPAGLTGVDKGTAAFWRARVEPVHRAACAGDLQELGRLMGGGHVRRFATEECDGCTAPQTVAVLREEYGLRPASLARLLETRPVAGQGGLVYHQGDRLAAFDRGAPGLPAVWSALYLQCHAHAYCTALRGPG